MIGLQAELRKRYPSAFELLECLKHAGDNLEEDAFIQQVIIILRDSLLETKLFNHQKG